MRVSEGVTNKSRSISVLCAGLDTLLTVPILLMALVLMVHSTLVSLGSPRWGTSPLRLLPGTHIRQFTATLTLTGASEFKRQVLRGNLSQQFLLVVGAQNVDLVHGDGVEEALDNAEDAAEAPGGVDEVQLAQTLGVVVLRDLGGLAHVTIHRRDAGHTDTLEVHDGAAGLEQLAGFAGAGRETGVGELFVLGDEVLQHTLTSGDLVHGVEVDLAELFDVDGAAILFRQKGSVSLPDGLQQDAIKQ